ncbi:DUF484 family protein [Neptunicella marina]|uniref:DUF484 family protein n=1 Tax=Neptunicella marina TaxID=2125989 RepID=A0A8J6M5J1_9ALTE|nr:DUF484 family protein [Neptunicella marina]MBC3766551.1 DUF484 family protein [Neptunicella marina]
MNETSRKEDNLLSDELTLNHVSRQQVEEYLISNPDFLVSHPNILNKIKVPHQVHGSVSLIERQAEQLREKVKILQKQLSELIEVAKQNERIYRIYADLNLRLFKCRSIVEVQQSLTDVLLNQLELDEVSLKLFGSDNDLPETSKHHLLKKRFNNRFYYLGRLSHAEMNMVFEKQTTGSVAMMLIGEQGEMGLLAIGCKQPHHFHPGMDTLLITQLQQFLTLVVPQLAEF